jgi:hypothetical protein
MSLMQMRSRLTGAIRLVHGIWPIPGFRNQESRDALLLRLPVFSGCQWEIHAKQLQNVDIHM